MTVEKAVEKKELMDLQDLRQQIESLASMVKNATIGKVRPKEGDGTSSPKKREVFQNFPQTQEVLAQLWH